MSEKILTVEEAADELGVSKRAVQNLCAKGILGATKPRGMRGWRIPRESLDEIQNIRR